VLRSILLGSLGHADGLCKNDQEYLPMQDMHHYHAKDALQQRSSLIQLIFSWLVEPMRQSDVRTKGNGFMACAPLGAASQLHAF
jgi:hypothetical protein